jgi:uncharacterized protein (PEP-CTERM system associated)
VRNTIVFSVFNVRTEQITAAGSPIPPLAGVLGPNTNNNTQTGVGIVWTNRLTEAMSLVSSLYGYRTVANFPGTSTTWQGVAQVGLSTPLSPNTSVFAGGRFQTFRSDLSALDSDYTEAAVILGLTYTFR